MTYSSDTEKSAMMSDAMHLSAAKELNFIRSRLRTSRQRPSRWYIGCADGSYLCLVSRHQERTSQLGGKSTSWLYSYSASGCWVLRLG